MERFSSLSTVARVAVVAGVLAIGGGATAAAVTLPSHANSHAVSATADVITGIPSSAPAAAGTPAPQASFGQCVAANAKTASDNGGQDWNPTTDCTKPGTEASDEVTTSTASGPADQSSHANPAASDGLATAATAGANGAAHANDNGADNAAARGDNAG